MDKEAGKAFLRALNGKQIKEGLSWIQTSCVLAPWKHKGGTDLHPSAALRIGSKRTIYNCFGCGVYSPIDLLYELKRLGASEPLYDLKTATAIAVGDDEGQKVNLSIKEWGEAPKEEFVTFPEVWLSSFFHALHSKRAMSYLATRQITPSVIEKLDIRYDTNLDAVAFPVRSFDGTLCGLRGRLIDPPPEFPRYYIYKSNTGKHNPVVFHGENLIDFDKPIVITESVFDLASVMRVYPNVVSPMSAGFTIERIKRLKQAVEVITFFDDDKAGDRARKTTRLGLHGAFIVDVFPIDGCKDPGEMSAEQVASVLRPYVKLTSEPVETAA